MTSYVLFLYSFLGSSYSSRPRPFRVFALSTTSLDSRLVATFCDSPLSTYPTHLSLRAAKGTRTRLAPSPPQSPASSPRPLAVPTLSGLIGDLGASFWSPPRGGLRFRIRLQRASTPLHLSIDFSLHHCPSDSRKRVNRSACYTTNRAFDFYARHRATQLRHRLRTTHPRPRRSVARTRSSDRLLATGRPIRGRSCTLTIASNPCAQSPFALISTFPSYAPFPQLIHGRRYP